MFKSLSCIWMEVSRVTCHVAGDELIDTQARYTLQSGHEAEAGWLQMILLVSFEDVTISLGQHCQAIVINWCGDFAYHH